MNNVPMDTEENEIDIKKLFLNLYHYKWMILLFVMLFGLASAYYAYFLPNVYRSTASVKVGLDEEEYAKDVISMAMGKGAVNASTEKDLIRSRYLATRALEEVDFREHYYETRDFKETELYKNAPFKVDMTEGYGISFVLTMVDDLHYQVTVKNYIRPNRTTLSYDKRHSLGEEVKTNDFQFTLHQSSIPTATSYRFVIDEVRKSFGSVYVSQNLENSTILQISVEDTVALRAQEYANALAQAYVHQNVESKIREAKQRIAFIDAQLSTVSSSIKNAANQLEDFRKSSKMVNVENKTENIATRLDNYEANLVDLTIKEEMLKSFYKQVKSKKRIETLSIEGIDDKDSILSGLMEKLQEAVVEKKLLREDYTNLHPQVLRVTRKITQLKSTIKHTVENLVKNIKKRKILLAKNIKKQKVLLNKLPENERKYGQLERKFKMNEEINSYLLKRKTEAEMIQASTVSKNRMLDSALLPRSPIKPKREFIVIIGVLLGLIFGILLALLRMLLDTKIKTENDISTLVEYPVLGTIPHFKEAEDGWKGKIKVFEESKSIVAESFRHLRSNIQFLHKQEGSQVILLTSTVGQEGKTTISVNLGAIMSLASKRTIIINLDMRKPTLHEKFDLPNTLGLSELLNERTSLKEVIQHTRYENLDIISSGIIPPNPSELIQSKNMYSLIEALKEHYDTIILDTPPIGIVTDAKALMYFVDINIYIVRADYSQKEFLGNLKKIDAVEKIPHLGIILNDVKMKNGKYGYYNRYGYGYYEEQENKSE